MDESIVLEILTDIFGQSTYLDLALIALLVVCIVLVSFLGNKSKLKRYVVKYIYLAEQVMFEDEKGQEKFDFAIAGVNNYLDGKSKICKWIFKLFFNKKVLTKMINKAVADEKENLNLIKSSNNTIANKSAQLFEKKVFDVMPDGAEKDLVVGVMNEVKDKDFKSDNTISAFAELRTDFHDETELRAGASINIKL